MNSTHTGRRIVRARRLLLLVALVAILATEFLLGEVLVARVGQSAAPSTEQAPVPGVSLGDALAAVP